jgi:site-specific DNA recombinase
VGYVRVSTDSQAQEGVSLDAQREKLKAYCSLHEVELIGIHSDEGLSASSLKRPGLQSALKLLQTGHANTIVVVKLDRLTRSLLDLDGLVRRYFASERFHLLSVSETLDTRTAMGRFVLYILGLIAQWEREAISERTKEALRHLKEKGVRIGAIEYGLRRTAELDEQGHRCIVEAPEELDVIRRILAMHQDGKSARAIGRELERLKLPGPRGPNWNPNAVLRVLERNQRVVRRPRPSYTYDPERTRDLAQRLRSEGLSLRAIARHLDAAGLKPQRGGKWLASTVHTLLQSALTVNLTACRGRAKQLRTQGLTLRTIGQQLLAEGYFPPHAAAWHPPAVSALLGSN